MERHSSRSRMAMLLLALFLFSSLLPVSPQIERKISSSVTLQRKVVTVEVYYLTDESWAKKLLDGEIKALPALEKVIGVPYDFKFDVKIVENPALSAQTTIWQIIAQTDCLGNISVSNRADVGTVLHESTHFWFCSKGVIRYSMQAMEEGSSEYFSYLALKEVGMTSEAEDIKASRFNEYQQAKRWFSPEPTIAELRDYGEDKKKEQLLYAKSTVFLFELAEIVGEEAMKGSNQYLVKKGKAVDHYQFYEAIQNSTERDVKDFMVEWLFPTSFKGKVEEWRQTEIKYNESLQFLDDNRQWFESRGKSIKSFEDELERAKVFMKNGQFEDASSLIDKVTSEMNQMKSQSEQDESAAQKAQSEFDAVKTDVESFRAGLEEGFIFESIDTDLKDAQNLLGYRDYGKLGEKLSEIRSKLSSASTTLGKYKEARDAQKAGGDLFSSLGERFGKDPMGYLEKAKESFNSGEYKISQNYSEETLKVLDLNKTMGRKIGFAAVAIAVLGMLVISVVIWHKKKRGKPS